MTDHAPAATLVPVESQHDADWCRDLLARVGLPTADLGDRIGSGSEPGPAHGEPTLYLVEADGDRVGCIGVERYGDAALLRSAAIAEAARGQGYGGRAVRAVETRAGSEGVETLYLLTTTAADFFAGLGYERIDREAVPDSVRGSAEFAELCPSSATLMRRLL